MNVWAVACREGSPAAQAPRAGPPPRPPRPPLPPAHPGGLGGSRVPGAQRLAVAAASISFLGLTPTVLLDYSDSPSSSKVSSNWNFSVLTLPALLLVIGRPGGSGCALVPLAIVLQSVQNVLGVRMVRSAHVSHRG